MPSEKMSIENKRFSLSPESRQVLPNAREGFKALKEKNPEVIGMTVFGSMVKGTDHAESDVDAFVFLDKKMVELDDDDFKWAQEHESENKHISVFDSAVVHHYESIIKSTFLENGLSERHVEEIRIRSIDKEEIDDTLKEAVEQKTKYLQKIKQYDDYMENSWPSEEGKVEYPDYDEDAKIPWKIPAMFHLQVGNELDSYRKDIIKALESNGEVGEFLWKDIVNRTADLERDMHGSSHERLFPNTLEDAKKYYKIE